jgi:hypothetical protein
MNFINNNIFNLNNKEDLEILKNIINNNIEKSIEYSFFYEIEELKYLKNYINDIRKLKIYQNNYVIYFNNLNKKYIEFEEKFEITKIELIKKIIFDLKKKIYLK